MKTATSCFSALFCTVLFSSMASAVGPQFLTWKDDPSYHQTGYPLVFVASYRDPSINNGGNFGADVLEAGAPTHGQELWMLHTDGSTEKLFPIPGVHDALVGVTPIGADPIIGSVTEPSVSIDGRRIYFAYFHDAKTFPPYCCASTGHSNFDGWPPGGDLYALNIGPKLDDPAFPVGQLQVSRLTQTTNWYEDALNPEVAAATESDKGGVVYTGAIEVETALGRKLVFVGNQKQVKNSNTVQHKKNKNFNLFTADIVEGNPVTIQNIRQTQYYTTTSALSPNRLRVGFAFSYQSNTEENRQWALQQLIGEKWTPLYGYGIVAEAAHLSTFCVKTTSGVLSPGDYEVVTQYYNANNNGFGFIAAQDMSLVGLNRYDKWSGAGVGWLPEQLGSYNLSPGVAKGDYPSPVGKYTAPACGGPDELYLTYDPGIANHRNNPYPYHPQIVFTNLEPGNPATSGTHTPVIVSPDTSWGAIWAKPIIDWTQRLTGVPHPTGNATQQPPPSVIDPDTVVAAGMPHAMFGTSALYNTDIKPIDCRDDDGFYDPYENGNTIQQIFKNIAALSQVMVDAPGNINLETGNCSRPSESDIFGISIYMTSNKINKNTYSPDYITEGGGTKEAKRLLGTFQVGMEGQTDTSFKAVVPANVPVDFQLLGTNGLKLADVRSWHSLKPRESRVDCGGCHQHRVGEAIPWDTSSSSDPAIPPLDMVDQTTYLGYDASCQPELRSTSEPVHQPPVWQELSAAFQQHCGDCHTATGTGSTTSSLNALTYDPAKLDSLGAGSPVREMLNKKYLDRFAANASRAFWAAYGARTDGRDNLNPDYQPTPLDYSACTGGNYNLQKCGFKFSTVHAGLPLCDGSDAMAADWVYRFGQWMDNHTPVDKGSPYGYQYDRYHPTVDGALKGGSDCLHPKWFRVGFWDDSGSIDELAIDVDGTNWRTLNDLSNGVYKVHLGGSDLTPILNVRVKVRAVDDAGNRQHYEKTIVELVQQCLAAGGWLPPHIQPLPASRAQTATPAP
ncbi:MAG: hypothetical protein V3R97_03480 [Gemmatimonadales bacterium]